MKTLATHKKGKENMAKVSLSQAAKDTGVSLPTLSRWRKAGKISADKAENGSYILDTAEYDRINDLKKQSSMMKKVAKANEKEAANLTGREDERAGLSVEVQVLRQRIQDKNEIIEDLRSERNDWKKQAQTLLLQAPKPKSDVEASEQAEKILASPAPKNDLPPPEPQKQASAKYVMLALLVLSTCGTGFWYWLENSNLVNDLIHRSKTGTQKRLEQTQATEKPFNYSFQQPFTDSDLSTYPQTELPPSVKK